MSGGYSGARFMKGGRVVAFCVGAPSNDAAMFGEQVASRDGLCMCGGRSVTV